MMSSGELFLIGIVLAMFWFIAAFFGAVFGSFAVIQVISRRLTGTQWTLSDILEAITYYKDDVQP